jgi:hypothetical protein
MLFEFFDGIHDACFRSSWSLARKHYQLSGAMRNANKAKCCPMCVKYLRKEKSERDNAVRVASIHSNPAALAAIAAQFRDGSGVSGRRSGPQIEITLRLQLGQAHHPSGPSARGGEQAGNSGRRALQHVAAMHGFLHFDRKIIT